MDRNGRIYNPDPYEPGSDAELREKLVEDKARFDGYSRAMNASPDQEEAWEKRLAELEKRPAVNPGRNPKGGRSDA